MKAGKIGFLLVCSIFCAAVSPEKSTDQMREHMRARVTSLIRSQQKGTDFSKGFQEIVKFGPPANPILLELAKKDEIPDHQRWTAIRAVGQIHEPDSVVQLVDFLGHPNPMLRIAGIRAIGDLKPEEIPEELLEISERDSALLVRTAGVETLGKLHAREAVPVLERVFVDEKSYIRGKGLFIRKQVVVAIGEIPSLRSTEFLIKALDDPDQNIPPVAIESLEKMHGKKFAAKSKKQVYANWKSWWQEQQATIPTTPSMPPTPTVQPNQPSRAIQSTQPTPSLSPKPSTPPSPPT